MGTFSHTHLNRCFRTVYAKVSAWNLIWEISVLWHATKFNSTNYIFLLPRSYDSSSTNSGYQNSVIRCMFSSYTAVNYRLHRSRVLTRGACTMCAFIWDSYKFYKSRTQHDTQKKVTSIDFSRWGTQGSRISWLPTLGNELINCPPFDTLLGNFFELLISLKWMCTSYSVQC